MGGATRRVREDASASACTEVSCDCAREEPRWRVPGEPPSGEIGSPGLFSPRATRALSPPRTPPAPTAIKTGVAAYLHTTYPVGRVP